MYRNHQKKKRRRVEQQRTPTLPPPDPSFSTLPTTTKEMNGGEKKTHTDEVCHQNKKKRDIPLQNQHTTITTQNPWVGSPVVWEPSAHPQVAAYRSC